MGGTASTPATTAPADGDAHSSSLSQSESKCPVDHSKLNKTQLAGFMHPFSGDKKHSTDSDDSPNSPHETSNPLGQDGNSGCPVDHQNMSKSQMVALSHAATMKGASPISVKSLENKAKSSQEAKTRSVAYDVYGQEINPTNMMPVTPNQLPSPGQSAPLSTAREASTIPKSGTGDDATWTYPSAQMFFNALKRKGKADDVAEDDMASVVAVHNMMNERTWGEVAAWEKRFHCAECPLPKLKRFMGRPNDLSPAARFRMWFQGYPQPFDRHDWTVDRCGLADVRYIIDYYYRDADGAGDPIEIHVRPALDSPSAIWDRLRASVPEFSTTSPTASTSTGPPPVRTVRTVAQDEVPTEEYESLRTLTPEQVQQVSDRVREKCSKLGEGFSKCREAGGRCEDENVSLNYCMARQICLPAADRFMQALENNGDETKAYSDMAACLDRFHVMARRVMMQSAGIKAQGPEFPTNAPAAPPEKS